VVTQAMTSLTGSAGKISPRSCARSANRMDRRAPLPPKPVQAAEVVEAAPAEPVADEDAGPAEITMADIVDQQMSGDPAPSARCCPA